MEITDREYKKCKYLIKSWERKFKQQENRIPTKEDIKKGPSTVKEAYKIYWYAKTSLLEETIINEENEQQPGQVISNISGSHTETDTKIQNGSDKTLVDVRNSLVKIVDTEIEEFPPEICSAPAIIQDNTAELKNSGTVWGNHLKKGPEKSYSTKLGKSSSFQFTEKLFKGSKFKKRNPRKFINPSERSKSTDNLRSTDDNSQNSVVSETDSLPNDLFEADGSQDNVFNYMNNVKVTSGKFFVTSAMPTNILHKLEDSVDLRSKIIKNKLDEGWLERCNKKCDIDNSIRFTSNKSDVIRERQEQGITSDEDYVYSSGDEEPNRKVSNLSFSSKKYLSSEILDTSGNISNPDQNSAVANLDAPTGIENTVNREESTLEGESCKSNNVSKYSLLADNGENNEEEIPSKSKSRANSNKKIIKAIGGLKRSAGDELSNDSKKLRTESNIDFIKERKIKLLREKVSKGTLNQNFVSIDLKRKRYARGKKTMTFSKYKKQQWKMKKKFMNNSEPNANADGTGVMKCFRCGDVGHFSRQCKKNNTLLPLEDFSDTEESPFPTLEEAAEMVKAKSKYNTENDDIEEMVAKLDSLDHPDVEADVVKHVPPLCNCEDDESFKDTAHDVQRALKKFGYETFRPGQKEAIMRILSGKSTLFVSSTGSGKSLCYQIPAYLFAERSNCISLVISPLVSLMEDQIINFPDFLNAACLHTCQSNQQREKIIDRLQNNKVSVLLISPEAMISGERGILGRNLMKNFPPIAFVCIDEVHCVSQWSHNFRTSYLLICKILKERFNVRTFLGLTATATKDTIHCIKEHLSIPHNETEAVLQETILPENLILSVSKDEDKDNALLTLLKRPPFSEFGSIIIYCIRRTECERLASFLRTLLTDYNRPVQMYGEKSAISAEVEVYHAGITAARRKKIQNYFMKGKLRIVVATVAFGMGINKSDIRGIIHYNMPRTFEHYVQEIGRAGRDGLVARCHLFYDSNGNDLPELKRFIYANSVDRHVIRKLLQKVFVPCKCTKTCLKHEIAFSVDSTVSSLDLFQENISTLLCYLELLPEKIVQVLPVAYTKCTVQSYNGELALRRAAKKCPPLAFAIAEHCKNTGTPNFGNKLEFSVVELADRIGWEGGVVKNELKRCEWIESNGKYKKTGVSINLHDLGFHVRTPGNLSETELDNVLDALYNRVISQENSQLIELEICNDAFKSISYKKIEDSLNGTDLGDRSNSLKELIRNYFSGENDNRTIKSTRTSLNDETAILCDIQRLVLSNGDCNFTGRAIARIFHGIESPNFPTVIWFRSPFWRCGLKEDFNVLCRIASKELVKLK